MSPFASRLSVGTLIAGRFRVLRMLGGGSMGYVYEAEDVTTLTRVAVKTMRKELVLDERARERFAREAIANTMIDHPNIATAIAVGVSDDAAATPYFVQELCAGADLDTLLSLHPDLPEPARWRLIEQMFLALAAAHDQGIVHRDLTPGNVMIDADSLHLKVLDFGLAKILGSSAHDSTAPGLGTPLWTAPEQGEGAAAPSPSADVWALGLLTFLVLTGQTYWVAAGKGGTLFDLVLELKKGHTDPASVRLVKLGGGAALPRGFDAWFARALASSPAARFPDARAAWDALAATRRRRPAWPWVVAILVCAAAIALVALRR